MFKKIPLLLALALHSCCGGIAVAALSEPDKAVLSATEVLPNGGFENGRATWVYDFGTLSLGSSATANADSFGKSYGIWNSSSAGQTLCNTTAVPAAHKGNNGITSVWIQTPSGTATHKIRVTDGTNTIAENDVISSATWTKVSTPAYVFPSSGNVVTCLVSVAADEPSINVDGFSTDLYTGFAGPRASRFGAKVSSAGVFSDIVNGQYFSATTFAPTDTSLYTIGFTGLTSAPNCEATVIGENRDVMKIGSETSSQVVIRTGVTDSSAFSKQAAAFSIDCQLTGADYAATQTGFMVSPKPWFIDATISGAQVDLGTSSTGDFDTGLLENASLTMTNNTSIGSDSSAQIGCSSTNAPTGLTCSSGSESVSLSFSGKSCPDMEVCFESTHFAASASNTLLSVNPNFAVVKTATNSQTLTATGEQRVTTGGLIGAIAAVANQMRHPFKVCGVFPVDTSRQMFRLRFTQTAGTAASNRLLIDGSTGTDGGRNMRVTAQCKSDPHPAALIKQAVVTPYEGGALNIVAAEIECDGSSQIVKQFGTTSNAVASVGNISTGVCAVTLASGAFSQTPICFDNHNQNISGTNTRTITSTGVSSTSVNLDCSTGAADCTSYIANLFCIGPK